MLKFYADGVLLGTHDAGASDHGSFTVDAATAVVSIECESTASPGGILAEIGDDYFTDATWKCLNSFRSDWTTEGFDDSTWLYATDVGQNSGSSVIGHR